MTKVTITNDDPKKGGKRLNVRQSNDDHPLKPGESVTLEVQPNDGLTVKELPPETVAETPKVDAAPAEKPKKKTAKQAAKAKAGKK